MNDAESIAKPLAGTCQHQWQDQQSPFILAQVCLRCRLFRYKASLTSDWEYRAPIPIAQLRSDGTPPA
jgi:hypothetical protein